MSPTIKISIAQTCPLNGATEFSTQNIAAPDFAVFDSIRQNLDVVARTVELASQNGSELVVFPEYFTQGSLDGRAYLAQPARHILQELQNLAIRSKISIAGTIVEPDNAGSQPRASPFSASPSNLAAWTKSIRQSHPETFTSHSPSHVDRSSDNKDIPREGEEQEQSQKLLNVAYFVEGGTGEVIGRYVKRNLWISEREYLHPGSEEHTVFQWRGITVGFLICWDLAHPLSAQLLAKQGADLIIAPTYWLSTDSEPAVKKYDPPADYEYQLVQSLAYARSFETETILAMCNAGGDEPRGFMGGSGIWQPFKGKLKGDPITLPADDATTDLRQYDVDLGILPVARRTYKIREDWEAEQR